MYKQVVAIILLSLAGLIFFISLQEKLESNAARDRDARLQKVHTDATNTFVRSTNQFVFLLSGMRSHIAKSSEFPSQDDLQDFLAYQVDYLNVKDTLIVSYINNEHEFIYSFSRHQIDPGGLIGKQVPELRDIKEIYRLNSLLTSDDMKVFSPINLVEGWVGIPINFRVKINGEVMGYIASVINFKNIIQPVDQLVDGAEFVIRFQVKDESEFDREQVYDGSKVYHSRVDTLSARSVDGQNTEWLSSDISLYGQEFIISSAYRNPFTRNQYMSWVFILLYIFIIGYLIFSVFKILEARRLNEKLELVNQQINEQNAELTQLNKTKDRFFSIIGHDLRGPLSSIIGLMSLAQAGDFTDDETKKILNRLAPAAKNTINLLEDLLRWAQINNKEISYNPQWAELDEQIEQIKELVTANAEMKDIRIESQLSIGHPVWMDKQMISTVIRNLLLNAIKFSPRHSQITIKTYLDAGNAVIQISDQGVGMSQERIDAIQTSRHVSTVGTSGETGNGLGLTISKAFIDEHKGLLKVRSVEGQGSQFIISLPPHTK